MKSFKNFQIVVKSISDQNSVVGEQFSTPEYLHILEDNLQEKLITFGGKAYPKNGQVVILAGAPASGKGFTVTNLLGIEGRTFDVDHLKKMIIRSDHIAKIVKEKTGIDVKNLNMKRPEDVTTLHNALADPMFAYPKREQDQMFRELTQIAYTAIEHKPNIIFDVTLEKLKKLKDLSERVQDIGYEKENIHIVWVLTHIEVARKQNQERERTIHDEILLDIAKGVSITMKQLLSDSEVLRKYADGDFWISTNTIGVDSKITKSGRGGSFVEKSNYFLIKKKGQAPKSIEEISKIVIGDTNLLQKIQDYTPKIDNW